MSGSSASCSESKDAVAAELGARRQGSHELAARLVVTHAATAGSRGIE
jgi:hypothetical protein